jgi:hypothetical protein
MLDDLTGWVFTLVVISAVTFSAFSSRMLFNLLNSANLKISALIKDVNILYRVVDDLIHPNRNKKQKSKTYKEIRRRCKWNSQHR